MATKVLKSLKGRSLRLTRLDNCGAHVVGPCSAIVTDGFITVELAPEKETGEEYTLKNANGDFCVNEKDGDRTKWVVATITMCEVHPDVADFIAGATPITDGTDTIGAAFGPDANANAFAVEVWTKQAGGACEGGAPEYGYFVAPYIINGSIEGSITIENAPLQIQWKGEAIESVADWGTGPHGDNPLLAAAGMPVGHHFAYVRTTVAPPAVTDGCVALA